MTSFSRVALASILLIGTVFSDPQLNVLPLPSSYKMLGGPVNLATAFSIQTSSTSKILSDACARYSSEIIFTHRPESTSPPSAPTMLKVTVVSNSEDTLQLGMDESYTLTTGTTNQLSANTVWGALRGLETFAQLVSYDYDTGLYKVMATAIQDEPRFKHRGLMTDIARHFQTPRSIRRLIDAMSYAKFNTLHMHLVDSQSFPVEVKTSPLLWEAAWSKQERMSTNDLVDLVQFGKTRGVRVYFEFDMPGHAESWCKGYPQICPATNCLSPLDPSNNYTFDLIDRLIGEYTNYFFDDYIHLGGDEVNTRCYTAVPHVAQWLKEHNFTANDGYKYFVQRAHDIGHKNHGKNVIQWVEVFDNFGTALAKDTIVHVWKAKSTLQKVVAAGYKALLSDYDLWYLDQLKTTWEQIYLNEPFQGITNKTQQDLILGGELPMWGETVDPSDIEQTIWPRAAAGAERLWSDMTINNTDLAKPRLEAFRCRLMQRGIAAAPLNNQQARESPPGPGSCSAQ